MTTYKSSLGALQAESQSCALKHDVLAKVERFSVSESAEKPSSTSAGTPRGNNILLQEVKKEYQG